jgi:putative Holliday junction resolvase
VCFDAIVIAFRKHRHHARPLNNLARIGEREEQPHVPRLPKLVQLRQACLKLRTLGPVAFFEVRDFRVDLVERRGGLFQLVIGAFEFRFFDLPLQFEAAKVAEQRAFLRCEAIGFFVQDAETLGRACRERFGPGLIGLLPQDGNCGEKQDCKEDEGLHKSYFRREILTSADEAGMRVLAIDLGRRRIGLAISDPSRTLARPLKTLTVEERETEQAVLERVLVEVTRLAGEDDGVAEIVVGVPARLDGAPTDETAHAAAFIDALAARVAMPVVREDERLTSREAESRLALRERDWKKRKERLDAAAAAIILQDYLDRHAR